MKIAIFAIMGMVRIVIIIFCIVKFLQAKQTNQSGNPNFKPSAKEHISLSEMQSLLSDPNQAKENLTKKLDELEAKGQIDKAERVQLEQKLLKLLDTFQSKKSKTFSYTQNKKATPSTLEELEKFHKEGNLTTEEYLKFQEKLMKEKYGE